MFVGESRRLAITPSQPSLQARSQGFGSVTSRDRVQRRPQRRYSQQRAPLRRAEAGHVATVQPEDVEDVIPTPAVPVDFAVEDHFVARRRGDRVRRRRENSAAGGCARKAARLVVLEREQADAVELALEDPLRSGEALLRQRGRHRDEPFRELHNAFQLGSSNQAHRLVADRFAQMGDRGVVAELGVDSAADQAREGGVLGPVQLAIPRPEETADHALVDAQSVARRQAVWLFVALRPRQWFRVHG